MLLQFITHATSQQAIVQQTKAVLNGGCKWIQLRFKTASYHELVDTAYILKQLCDQYKAHLIINDFADICAKVKAHGLHLGLQDLSIQEARKIVGQKVIIGGTANTLKEAVYHIQQGANYLGIGPYTKTFTKKNLSTQLGIKGYKEIISELNLMHLRIPILAIGGIKYTDIKPLMQTGIDGIALSGYLIQSKNTEIETQEIMNLIKQNKL